MPEQMVDDPSSLGAGGGEGQPEGQPAKPEITLESLAQELSGMKAGFGKIPNLESSLAKLPKTFEDMISKQFQGYSQKQILNNLSPEAYEAYQSQQRQDGQFKQTIAGMVQSMLPEMFPDLFEINNRAKQMFQGMDFMNGLREFAGDDDEKWGQFEPIYQELLKENAKKYQDDATWQDADKWLSRGIKEPSWVHLQALERLQKSQQAGADGVKNARQQAQKQFGKTPGGSAPRGGSGPLPALADKKGWEALANQPGMTAEKLQELVKQAKASGG